MKIALIHSHLSDRGGSQRYVIEIGNHLKALGVDVDIFCYEYNRTLCYPELTEQLNIEKIYTRETCAGQCKAVGPSRSFRSIFKTICKNKIINKIISVSGVDYLGFICLVNSLATQLSESIIATQNDYDLIFAHEEPLSVYAAIKYKKHKDVPVYWFCYDTIEKWFLEWEKGHRNSSVRKFLLQNIYFKHDRYLIRKYVDKSAVLDNVMLARYQRLYGNIPLVRRGGLSEFVLALARKNVFRERYHLSQDTIVIFSLTRFVEHKRVHDIFEVYKRLDSDIKKNLFIYINSPITDEEYYKWCMENYKEVLQNGNIVISIEYPQNDDDMYDMYLSSDIFIFPNENQTWGHAPLEAMGCGVVAIVSTGCGISEVVQSVTPDAIYEVGNTNELNQILQNMVRTGTWSSLGQKQKKYVKNNLTWTKVCEQYLDDFKDIISK